MLPSLIHSTDSAKATRSIAAMSCERSACSQSWHCYGDTVFVTDAQIEQELRNLSCTCRAAGVPQDVTGCWWVDSFPVPVAEHADSGGRVCIETTVNCLQCHQLQQFSESVRDRNCVVELLHTKCK